MTGTVSGGGGGGRIAATYMDASQFDLAHIEAKGGSWQNLGGDGTVFPKRTIQANGELVISGQACTLGLDEDSCIDRTA